MSNTPYFNAYEARRRSAVNMMIDYIPSYRSRYIIADFTCNHAVMNSLRFAGPVYDSVNTAGSSGQVLTSDGTNVQWRNAPQYRLKKTYGFILDQRVLIDAVLEMRDDVESDWIEVPETFNNYQIQE